MERLRIQPEEINERNLPGMEGIQVSSLTWAL
jgi:hypothetical protein